jgi:hypothetical protein
MATYTQSVGAIHERFRKSSIYIWDCFHVMHNHIDQQYSLLSERLDSDSPPSQESIAETDRYLRVTLGNTTRYSLFVLLLGLCEDTVVRLCRLKNGNQMEAIYESTKQKRHESRLSYHLRLLNNSGISFESLYDDISLLDNAMRIRHCIAHAFGDVDAMKDPSDIEKAISNVEGTCISRDRHVFINDEAITRSRTAIVRLVETVVKAQGYTIDLRLAT